MKKEELRIGSWYHSVKFGVPVRCDLSDLYNLSAIADGAYDDPPIDDMFEPLLLTEEWLCKLGFEERGINGWFEKIYGSQEEVNIISININSSRCNINCVDDDNEGAYIGYELKYVHQLQSIYFALTGKELMV